MCVLLGRLHALTLCRVCLAAILALGLASGPSHRAEAASAEALGAPEAPTTAHGGKTRARVPRGAFCRLDAACLAGVGVAPLAGPGSVAFSPDGKCMAVGGRLGVCLYNAATQKELRRLAHRGACWSLAFSPDGQLLAIGWSAAVQLWDLRANRTRWDVAPQPRLGRLHALAFSPDGSTLAVGAWTGTAVLLEVSTGREVRR